MTTNQPDQPTDDDERAAAIARHPLNYRNTLTASSPPDEDRPHPSD